MASVERGVCECVSVCVCVCVCVCFETLLAAVKMATGARRNL